LGDESGSSQWIASVRGIGYRFVGEVDAAPALLSPATPLPDLNARHRNPDAETAHKVTALNRQALELLIRQDFAAYKSTVARLGDRNEFGSDLRARALSLLHQVWQDRAESCTKAWQTLQRAEQLVERLDCPIVKLTALQAKALFLKQYVSQSEALPLLQAAMNLAVELPDPIYAADCAALLSITFGTLGEASACAQWLDESVALAGRVDPPSIRTVMLIAAAGSRSRLGEAALEQGDSQAASEHFRASLFLLEDAEADGDPDTLATMSTFIQCSRATALARVDLEARASCIQTLQKALGETLRPLMRLECLLELGRILRDAGRLREADERASQALDLATASRSTHRREELLLLAADIASRQGQHATAVRRLHELLGHQKQVALQQAATAAKVTSLRMDTERALAAAKAERAVSQQMRSEIELLRRRLDLAVLGHRDDGPAGELPIEEFWAFVCTARSRAVRLGVPFWMAIIALRRFESQAAAGGAKPLAEDPCGIDTDLAAIVRSTDRWTRISNHCMAVALSTERPRMARSAANRIQQMFKAQPASGSLAGHIAEVMLIDGASFRDDEELIRHVNDASRNSALA
jgi:tetratricopeptide (TPR) repeat protein